MYFRQKFSQESFTTSDIAFDIYTNDNDFNFLPLTNQIFVSKLISKVCYRLGTSKRTLTTTLLLKKETKVPSPFYKQKFYKRSGLRIYKEHRQATRGKDSVEDINSKSRKGRSVIKSSEDHTEGLRLEGGDRIVDIDTVFMKGFCVQNNIMT